RRCKLRCGEHRIQGNVELPNGLLRIEGLSLFGHTLQLFGHLRSACFVRCLLRLGLLQHLRAGGILSRGLLAVTQALLERLPAQPLVRRKAGGLTLTVRNPLRGSFTLLANPRRGLSLLVQLAKRALRDVRSLFELAEVFHDHDVRNHGPAVPSMLREVYGPSLLERVLLNGPARVVGVGKVPTPHSQLNSFRKQDRAPLSVPPPYDQGVNLE